MSRSEMVRREEVKIGRFKLSCLQASALMSQAQERALGPVERVRLRLHLAVCAGCANFLRQLEFIRAAVRRYRDRETDSA